MSLFLHSAFPAELSSCLNPSLVSHDASFTLFMLLLLDFVLSGLLLPFVLFFSLSTTQTHEQFLRKKESTALWVYIRDKLVMLPFELLVKGVKERREGHVSQVTERTGRSQRMKNRMKNGMKKRRRFITVFYAESFIGSCLSTWWSTRDSEQDTTRFLWNRVKRVLSLIYFFSKRGFLGIKTCRLIRLSSGCRKVFSLPLIASSSFILQDFKRFFDILFPSLFPDNLCLLIWKICTRYSKIFHL